MIKVIHSGSKLKELNFVEMKTVFLYEGAFYILSSEYSDTMIDEGCSSGGRAYCIDTGKIVDFGWTTKVEPFPDSELILIKGGG